MRRAFVLLVLLVTACEGSFIRPEDLVRPIDPAIPREDLTPPDEFANFVLFRQILAFEFSSHLLLERSNMCRVAVNVLIKKSPSVSYVDTRALSISPLLTLGLLLFVY